MPDILKITTKCIGQHELPGFIYIEMHGFEENAKNYIQQNFEKLSNIKGYTFLRHSVHILVFV